MNYSNGDTQYKKYIEDTIRPLERRLTMIINTIMSEAFGDQVKFQLHDKHINDLEERTRVQKEQIAFGIKVLNEIREENGDELYDIPEADLPFMSRGVIPIEMSGLDSYKINNNES